MHRVINYCPKQNNEEYEPELFEVIFDVYTHPAILSYYYLIFYDSVVFYL